MTKGWLVHIHTNRETGIDREGGKREWREMDIYINTEHIHTH